MSLIERSARRDVAAIRKAAIPLVGWICALVVLLSIAFTSYSDQQEAREPALNYAPAVDIAAQYARIAEERRKGFYCLSAWDGSNDDLVAQVKAALRNPDSFVHLDTLIGPVTAAGHHPIRMKYRAENGFGGMNIEEAVGFVDPSSCKATVIASHLSS